ncbi:MAG TPA: hypothetical protein VF473_01580 [Cyclobacteriaceae bacterium]
MRKRAFLRGIMLAAGLIAACAILLSPGFSHPKKEKVNTAHGAEKETVLIQAPSEAIPGNAVTVNEPVIPVITEIAEPEKIELLPAIDAKEVTKYLKVLFRTLITPNAP